MKFSFVGDPKSGQKGYKDNNPAYVEFYGIQFPYAGVVEVTDPLVQKKLLGNSHFHLVEDDAKSDAETPEPEETETVITEPAEEPRKEPTPEEKAKQAIGKALQAGLPPVPAPKKRGRKPKKAE